MGESRALLSMYVDIDHYEDFSSLLFSLAYFQICCAIRTASPSTQGAVGLTSTGAVFCVPVPGLADPSAPL